MVVTSGTAARIPSSNLSDSGMPKNNNYISTWESCCGGVLPCMQIKQNEKTIITKQKMYDEYYVSFYRL